ncbi:MAG: tetratricopeptide repeat protein [Bacteroidetes bacterium]|nr:tetratricopeptide repeat protein [Bacteroidota bacterium]
MNRLLIRIVFFFAGRPNPSTDGRSTSVFGLLTSNLLFCYTIALLSSLPLAAQNTSSKGDRYFDKNLFQEAIKYYQSEIKSGRKKTLDHAMLRLADCYRIIGEFELAAAANQKILKKKKNKENPLSYLNYGQSLKSSAKYAEAKIQFEEYIKMKPDDPMGKVLLASCDSAQLWLEQTLGKEVMNLEKINTNLSDFSPIILNSNELVFTTVRSDSKRAFISFNGGLEVNKMDIYKVNMNDLSSSKDIKPANMKELNSIFHEGPATFNSLGNQVYFTRTVKGKKDKQTNEIISTLQIFFSIKDSLGKWSIPVSAFNFNSDKYSVGHPSLSKDENFLFFISDMPGGYGKTDIYYLEKREDGSWTEPTNAGNKVNTFGYELFPYIAENGTLYFSSDAHPGMGQLDIFSAQYKKLTDGREGKIWTNISNLKPPINSIGNDFGIVLDGEYFRGFFSSDRFNGKG